MRGQLEGDYRAVARLSIVEDRQELATKIRELRERGFSAAIANTCAVGDAVAVLAGNDIVSTGRFYRVAGAGVSSAVFADANLGRAAATLVGGSKALGGAAAWPQGHAYRSRLTREMSVRSDFAAIVEITTHQITD